MEQYPYRWQERVIKASFPSLLNWLVSLLALISVFVLCGIVIFDQKDFLTSFLVEQRANVILPGALSFWFLFRGGFALYRGILAAWYLYVEFPIMRKNLPDYAPYEAVGIIYTAYEKERVEIVNALSSIYLMCYNYGAERVYLMAGMSKGKKGEDEFRIVEEVRNSLIASARCEEERKYYEDNIILVAYSQDGSGKRMAEHEAAEFVFGQEDVALISMQDGDTCCDPHEFEKIAPFFQCYDKLGAMTVANQADVEGPLDYNIYCHLRFVNRHPDLAFASTVLTGRKSVIRGNILAAEGALETLLTHYVTWKGKKVLALTGDDKTMVRLVWEQGYETAYAPDVMATAMEKPLNPPSDAWMTSITRFLGLLPLWTSVRSFWIQETRYSGNMLLHSASLREHVQNSGNLNARLKLLDQRYFPWSALVGPYSGILAACVFHPTLLVIWFMGSLFLRTILTLMKGMMYGYWHPLMPLMSFSNIPQAIIKTYRLYNLKRQSWSRGGKGSTKKVNHLKPLGLMAVLFGVIALATIF